MNKEVIDQLIQELDDFCDFLTKTLFQLGSTIQKKDETAKINTDLTLTTSLPTTDNDVERYSKFLKTLRVTHSALTSIQRTFN